MLAGQIPEIRYKIILEEFDSRIPGLTLTAPAISKVIVEVVLISYWETYVLIRMQWICPAVNQAHREKVAYMLNLNSWP